MNRDINSPLKRQTPFTHAHVIVFDHFKEVISVNTQTLNTTSCQKKLSVW